MTEKNSLKVKTTAPEIPKSLAWGLWSMVFDIAYFSFGLFYFPLFIKKANQAADRRQLWQERWGKFPESLKAKLGSKPVVWLHAVSVGEVMAVRRFIQSFLEARPEIHLVLTTVTPTGQKIAKEMESTHVTVLYFPFDFSWVCQSFFETLRPKALLLAETEIWPNLLLEAKKFEVPVGILNARLSEKSFNRYQWFHFIFKRLWVCLDFVLAQTATDAKRFEALGIDRAKIAVLGNMKFDNVNLVSPDPEEVQKLRQEWGLQSEDRVWIAGSTHAHEEEIAVRVYRRLRKTFPRLKLIVAPRHIERSEEILAMIQKQGLQGVLASERRHSSFDVLVLNQLGVLKSLYQFADVVLMGGSLIKHGGQNPIEPASFKKPVVHGPFTFNFESIYRELDQEGGALEIQNEADLTQTLQRLLQQGAEACQRGERAFEKVRSFQGATAKQLERVLQFLQLRHQERKNHGNNDSKLFPQIGGRL